MSPAVIARQSWNVRRSASITRERKVEDDGSEGDVQYTVRILDTGRKKPFIQQSFYTLETAQSFVERIRKESEHTTGNGGTSDV